MSKERIEIIDIIELNENGVRVEEQDNPLALRYFDDNGGSPDGNFDEDNIAGSWVLVDGRCEIGTFAYRSIDDCTLIDEKDFRNYLISKLEKNYNEEEIEKLLEDAREKIKYDKLLVVFSSTTGNVWCRFIRN